MFPRRQLLESAKVVGNNSRWLPKSSGRQAKWEELHQMLEEEGMTLYGVAETHLRELEQPPINPRWNWGGCNRDTDGRKGGGVGFLWCSGSQWVHLSSSCANHTWVAGCIHNIHVIACAVYLGVSSDQRTENSEVVQCIKHDIERWGRGKQVMLLGDFNAHIQELDGYTDHNGALVQSLSDELCLCIVNLRGRLRRRRYVVCPGQPNMHRLCSSVPGP